jgi:hypothetical protein
VDHYAAFDPALQIRLCIVLIMSRVLFILTIFSQTLFAFSRWIPTKYFRDSSAMIDSPFTLQNGPEPAFPLGEVSLLERKHFIDHVAQRSWDAATIRDIPSLLASLYTRKRLSSLEPGAEEYASIRLFEIDAGDGRPDVDPVCDAIFLCFKTHNDN